MEIKDLIKKFDKKRMQELALLDCLASSLSVNSIFKDDGVDFSAITPKMEEAFNLQFPNLELSDLENYSGDQIQGIINGWKGKLFEVNLRDGLNDGHDIGGIKLDYGQHAELIQNPTNEGFDLIITDDNSGEIVEELQAKASESISYIKDTIEKYPEYDIISTEETADLLGSDFDTVTEINCVALHNSGMSNEELSEELDNVFQDESVDLLAFSFLIVPMFRNGRRYLAGRYTVEKAVSTFVKDSSKSAIAIAGGGVLALLGLGTGIGILATFAIRMAIQEDKNWGDLDRTKDIKDIYIWPDLDKYKNVKDSDIW